MRASIRRWSDNDRYFGPFTFAYDGKYRPFYIGAQSGDDEYPGGMFRLSAFGLTAIAPLPERLFSPHKVKIYPNWDKATVELLGRDWYWRVTQREYGLNYCDGLFSVRYGIQTMDSSTEKSWSKFLPWMQWRHVRLSFYGLAGEHVATIVDSGKSLLLDPTKFERERAIEAATPAVFFNFDDFDGERIQATTRISEREWRFGEGWFKWLAWFRKPKVKRYLDLQFSSEVGERKGSWKGGTIGHGIEMLPNELHEAAFRRYCAENKMTFVGVAS